MPPEDGSTRFEMQGSNSEDECQKPDTPVADESYDSTMEYPDALTAIGTFMGLALFVLFGHLRDFLRRMGWDKTMDSTEYGNKVAIHT